MKKRWIGYAVWLLLSACLYFFENNTGTRVILICSLLFPLIPFFRAAFFSDRKLTALRTGKYTRPVHSSRQKKRISDYHRLEGEEPGDLRLYQPGDPVRRIHWKLSAKKDELLIRESAPDQEIREAEQDAAAESLPRKTSWRGPLLWGAVCVIVLCVLLFMLIPEAIRGAQALCNRIFAASEAANAYAYTYFPVPEGQSVTLALALIAAGVLALLSVMVLRRSRFIAFVLLAAVTLFQVYFGLPLPGWINILLYGALALWILPFSADRRAIPGFIGFVLLVALLVALLAVLLVYYFQQQSYYKFHQLS